MALPTILVNSATGSDSAASGAGPATALTGSAASTDATGLIVTLDGSPDLTGVATDGSHVIFLNDTTAGARNFGKITAKDNTAKTVTVSNAFALSASDKAWAIGGKRASIGSTTSIKMFTNNSTPGDVMPGWTVEMESGHAETIAGTVDFRRSGDGTDGPIVIKGTFEAAVRPVVTFSNNATAIASRGTAQVFQDFEIQNSHPSKTASTGLSWASSSGPNAIRMTISHSTNKFHRGMAPQNGGQTLIKDCEIGYCASHGIDIGTGVAYVIVGCKIHHNGGSGILQTSATTPITILYNQIYANIGDGYSTGVSTGTLSGALVAFGNTFHGNGGDGMEITAFSVRPYQSAVIMNNIFTNNGGYGLNFSHASITLPFLQAVQPVVAGNTFGSGDAVNTGGALNPSGASSILTLGVTADPSYVNAAAADFRPTNSALRGTAYPEAV